MNKNIIKLAIILVVAVLVYSVFWFFKVGQVEKKIGAFVSDNNSAISVGDISVSGFPFSQKITIKDLKFSIPNSPLSKYEILVKNIEAKTGVFSSDFSTTIAMGSVSLQDSDDKALNVEFNQEPKIDFLLSDEGFARITYQDSGHKVLDSTKNAIYSTTSSIITFVANVNDEGKVVNKVDVDIKGIVGFDVADLYKNSLEKRIVNGLKTGEIVINSSGSSGNLAQNLVSLTSTTQTPTAAVTEPVTTSTTPANPTAATANIPSTASDVAKQIATAPVADPAAAIAAAVANDIASNVKPEAAALVKDVVLQAVATTEVANPTSTSAPTALAPTNSVISTPDVAIAAPTSTNAAPVEVTRPEPLKSNLMISLEFFTSDGQNSSAVAIPLDPAQIQEAAPASSQGKTIKINNLEFSNDLYKLYVNGELNSFHDDNSLSGSISVKVEKISNLISSLLEGFKNILADNKNSANSGSVAAAPDLNVNPDNSNANAADKKEDLYQIFLNRLIANLDPISKELAAKNPVTKEDVAVFDIRREKNLEFLVNETSVREVLGKL